MSQSLLRTVLLVLSLNINEHTTTNFGIGRVIGVEQSRSRAYETINKLESTVAK